MSAAQEGMALKNLYPFFLAILLIFVAPMWMRRYGMDSEDLMRMLFSRLRKRDHRLGVVRPKREPWQANGHREDVRSLVSALMIVVRRKRFGLVYPGTVERDGQIASLAALIVTRKEIVGVNCFGFGGAISEQSPECWRQRIHGAEGNIPNPLEANRTQWRLVRATMDDLGLCDVPLRMVAVFTAQTLSLRTDHPGEVMDVEGLIAQIRNEEASGPLDPEALSRKLNERVVRIRRTKK